MYDIPQNTIFSYLSNTLFDRSDWSNLPVKMLAQEINKFKRSRDAIPETDALKFYFLNHAFHSLKSKYNPLEPLSNEALALAEDHIRITNEIAKRLLFYSVVICVEEARFIPSQDQSFFDTLEQSYGDEFVKYVKNGFSASASGKTQKVTHDEDGFNGYGRSSSLTSFEHLNMTCGEFTSAMVSVFAFGHWQHGFGGRGWVPIASLVADCISGKISLEGFADQAFSLSHNNGSMFNKGHFYQCYTQFIYDILDIQDSGQIPQWIGNNKTNRFVDSDLKNVFEKASKVFPEEMSGKIDMSLIKNSSSKRQQKQQAIAKKNAAMWNAGSAQKQQQDKPKEKPQIEMDKILLNSFKNLGF